MGKKTNETENEKKQINEDHPLEADTLIKQDTDSNGTDESHAEEKTESRPSVRDDAPSANESGRETVSKAPNINDLDAPEVKRPESKEAPKSKEKRIAGGMKTISDRQALLAREMSKNVGSHDLDEMLDLYSQARERLNEANKNLTESPESIENRDRAVANLLAVHQSMVNAKDPKKKEFAESCVEVNRWSFGISVEDCDKFTKDVADPSTDWAPAEETVAKEDQPKRLAGYAKAELEGLKGKTPNELVDYFNKARRDAKNDNAKNEKENTKESREAFERSFGKMLAGEYLLRSTPGLQAQSTLNSSKSIYENTFHMSQQDRDAMMEQIKDTPAPQPEATPVNTPTVEGVQHPVNDKNEYPEEPEEKKPEKVKQKKDSAKEEKLSPEQLRDRMEHAGELLGATIGKAADKDGIARLDQCVSDLQNYSPELRGAMFSQLFRDHAKNELQNSISSTLNGRKNGKMGATFSEASAATQNYLKAQFDYYTETNPDLKGMKYPTLGGLQPSEVRDMQNSAFLSLPLKSRHPNEKRAINAEYNTNKSTQQREISTGFRSYISNLNREQNLQFSSDGIEKYLAARWKEGAGKDLDTQRESFQKEYAEFKEKAYEQMLSKIDGKTDLKKQLESFDKFCTQLDTLCKAKGWVDKDTPYAFAGDLSADTVKNMQTKAVDKLPKNTAEQSKDALEDILGEKEIALQAEKAKKQKEAINKIKGSSKKDKETRKNLQNQAALDEKKSQKRLKQKEKNFKKEIRKYLDAVPANPQSFDNPGARNALGMARALENKLGEHGKAWRFFHPFQTRKLNNAINGIMKGLEEKGYKKEAVDHLLHNPQKPENDPVSQDNKKQRDDIKEMQDNRVKYENEQREFLQNNEKLQMGERITVPEADNLKEIVNPKERSKFIVPQRTNELSIGAPLQTQNVQQPQGPTTGK